MGGDTRATLLLAASLGLALGLLAWQLTDPAQTPAPAALDPAAPPAARGSGPGHGPGPLTTPEATPTVGQRAPAPAAQPGETEPERAPLWTEERIFAQAATHFQVDARQRELILTGFQPWAAAMEPAELQDRFGLELTPLERARLQELEQPYNDDLEALGELLAVDIDTALRDTWVNGLYHVEEVAPGEELRQPMEGESRIAFPGKAFFYSLPLERYPHLGEHHERRRRLVHARAAAVRGYLDELEAR